jgi:hypothetical protein
MEITEESLKIMNYNDTGMATNIFYSIKYVLGIGRSCLPFPSAERRTRNDALFRVLLPPPRGLAHPPPAKTDSLRRFLVSLRQRRLLRSGPIGFGCAHLLWLRVVLRCAHAIRGSGGRIPRRPQRWLLPNPCFFARTPSPRPFSFYMERGDPR